MIGNGTRQLRDETWTDFDLHGVVAVRLVGASAAESAAVSAQCGGMHRPLVRDPDIIVRFVRQLPAPDLCYVERGRNGFTDDGFFILSHRRRAVRMRFPFDQHDGPYEIVCEHGARSVPFLDALIKLVALRNGYTPLHAAGFTIDGAGVVVAGWPRGGKTSCLLAFARAGATFLSDDMVLLSADGRQMFGVPTPIGISESQLSQLPYVPRSRTHRLLVTAAQHLTRWEAGARSSTVRHVLHDLLRAVERRLRVDMPAHSVFGHSGSHAGRPHALLLTLSHAARDIRVEPADPATVATQLATLLRHELMPCFEQYLAYRFACPAASRDWLDDAEQEAAAMLRRALADKLVLVVRHPHPVSLTQLHRALRPYLRAQVSPQPNAWRGDGAFGTPVPAERLA